MGYNNYLTIKELLLLPSLFTSIFRTQPLNASRQTHGQPKACKQDRGVTRTMCAAAKPRAHGQPFIEASGYSCSIVSPWT